MISKFFSRNPALYTDEEAKEASELMTRMFRAAQEDKGDPIPRQMNSAARTYIPYASTTILEKVASSNHGVYVTRYICSPSRSPGLNKWTCTSVLRVGKKKYVRCLAGSSKKQARQRVASQFLEILSDFHGINYEPAEFRCPPKLLIPVPAEVYEVAEMLDMVNDVRLVKFADKERKPAWEVLSMRYNADSREWVATKCDCFAPHEFGQTWPTASHKDMMEMLNNISPRTHRMPCDIRLMRRHYLITGFLQGKGLFYVHPDDAVGNTLF
jgi:hypothetical protein